MSSRPSPPVLPPPETDLESTGELPVLDPADAESTAGRHAGTDTWILSPEERGSLASAAPVAEEQRQLAARLATAEAKLREAQQLLSSPIEQLRQLERAREDDEVAHAAAQERIVALTTELGAAQDERARQAARVAAAERAQADAEQRAASAAAELAQARELMSALGERVAQLQRSLEEHQSASHAQQARDVEQQQSQAAHSRAMSERLSADLELERARCLSYLEILQTREARRQIAVGLAAEFEQELAERADEVARVTRELGGRSDRVRELEGELGAARARLQVLAAAAGEREQSDAQRQAEMQRLLAERADLDGALAAARTAAADAAAQAAAHAGTLTAERARAEQLRAALTAEQQRAAGIESELEGARAEMEAWSGVLRTVHQERSAQLAGADTLQARARELEREVAQQRTAAAALQTECDARAARIRELESDLHAAEDTVHQLESLARSRKAQGAGPEKPAEARPAAWTRQTAAVDTPAPGSAAGTEPVPEPTTDGAMRLLIRGEGGREIVHVLGRKTSIGRTKDNDLQIEAKHISRHHAVILAAPSHTIIEDLNSTNGVLVNGRRITRQILHDGDQITIGRTLYRFAERRAGEKR